MTDILHQIKICVVDRERRRFYRTTATLRSGWSRR